MQEALGDVTKSSKLLCIVAKEAGKDVNSECNIITYNSAGMDEWMKLYMMDQ